MAFILIGILVIAMVFGPSWWAKLTFKRYSKPEERIPGTGGELAQHLLNRFEMHDVTVEKTDKPGTDHYDPESRTVRLSPEYFDQKSLTAVAIAAHEVGHAIQHFRNEKKLNWRTKLVKFAQGAQQIGAGAMMLIPVLMAITKAPQSGALFFLFGIISMGSATLVHLITLPVEFDASFGKALPILKSGEYIEKEDEPAVEKILRAAALTYVAASLASLLNIWRWLALLRRR
ncbi:hypothetical protein QYM36_019579 [Artemia franciscana]|uniref:Zinc metallopeptidase n=2 Tax=Artemia franciscana TaxID=6661 RepID=A0AA88H7N7_ARTSF|nr:hypothetical protein QYM36_019579 [Artemia franciscana]